MNIKSVPRNFKQEANYDMIEQCHTCSLYMHIHDRAGSNLRNFSHKLYSEKESKFNCMERKIGQGHTSFNILCNSSLASTTRSLSLLSTTNIRPCVFWK